MRRVVIPRPGGYERLRIEEQPDPTPGNGQVLVGVDAIGVNFADCITRMGLYASAKAYVGYPITPGFEVAGEVLEIGSGVEGLAVGDRVIGLTRFGGYATRVVLPRQQVFAVPSGLTQPQAAGFCAVFLTAWFGLFELAHPRPGEHILVHSAAGGVGGALVQLGKLAGCPVVGVVGAPHKVATVSSVGADAVIDKSTEALWPAAERHAPAGYGVVLDANGAETLAGSYAHLAPAGRLVVYGFHSMLSKSRGRPNWLKLAVKYLRTPRFNPLRLTAENRGVLGFNLSFLFERMDLLLPGLCQLFEWAEAGRLRPLPVTTYPFERVADAHRDLESGRTVGKLVLVTGSGD